MGGTPIIFDNDDPVTKLIEFFIILASLAVIIPLVILFSPYYGVKKLRLRKKMKEYADYQDYNNIDAPIADICKRMAKMGLKTTNSCCGFDFPTKLVKHHVNPYIGFNARFEDMRSLASKFDFCGVVWHIKYATERIQRSGDQHSWVMETQAKGEEKIWDQIRGCLDRMESEEE